MIPERDRPVREERHELVCNVIVGWLDDTANRVAIEEGGYGDVDALVTALFRELDKPLPSLPQKR